ncbi:MAG: NAD(P)H-hydrate dehydratase [Aquificae bacterium]|nr:NAD(P)H-hydrate dehydratase [Aquificota bacterium]
MKLVTASQMQELDRRTIEDVGVPSLVLMENAARGVAKAAVEFFPGANKILVVAGKGNNGGDGIAAARTLLLRYKKKVEVFLPYSEEELKDDCRVQYRIARKLGITFHSELPPPEEYDLVIDAVFGTGFKPPVKGRWAEVIKAINASGRPVLAVDVPSGISSDSGEVIEPVVRADLTVTFALPKYGHVLYPASAYCGKVLVREISIPVDLWKDELRTELVELEEVKRLVPIREPYTYKNREGHVLVVGGSVGKTGAVVMAARAATEAGAGLVTVGIALSLNPIIEGHLVEEMSLPLPEVEEGKLHPLVWDFVAPEAHRFSSIVLGPGMGRYKEGQELVADFLTNWERPIVVDADGLNNLADMGKEGKEILKRRRVPAVLTPHLGEMQRLTGLSSKEIMHNQVEVARRFAEENNCFVVLKGARTVVAAPDGEAFVSVRGTPAMAKGGVGDVLAGVLGALVGKTSLKEALVLGVSLHAVSGEITEDRKDAESLRATDLIANLGAAYRFLRNYEPSNDRRKNFIPY